MVEVSSAALALLVAGSQQGPVREQLVIVAIANAVAWVGLFLLMLWLFNRRAKSVEDRISHLETSLPDEYGSDKK